ncbi:hypothetical protein FACS189416_1780 [Bacteroidia bacterium]|nr:hypothetical protein FACS189416_1780 [Bacteroidia bacterium]
MDYYTLKLNGKDAQFTFEELKKMKISEDTLVWKDGYTHWVFARDVPEFDSFISRIYQPPIPKTWLVQSIFVTLFCCLPFGIVAIINAAKVESLYLNKQFEMADRVSRQAGKCVKLGFWIAFCFWILYIIVIYCLLMQNDINILKI